MQISSPFILLVLRIRHKHKINIKFIKNFTKLQSISKNIQKSKKSTKKLLTTKA